jgi:hypothetical protein
MYISVETTVQFKLLSIGQGDFVHSIDQYPGTNEKRSQNPFSFKLGFKLHTYNHWATPTSHLNEKCLWPTN